MSVKLAFIGTGTCNASRRNPSSLAFSGGDEVICVDFGGGAYHQLTRLSDPFFNYKNISTIFLTHFHTDHVSGIPDLLWGEMWDFSGRRDAPLQIVGPHGLNNFYQYRLLPFLGDYPLPFEVKLVELSDGEMHEGTFYTARSYALSHGESCSGYLFELGGKRVAVTGDTGYCERLLSLLRESEIAVIEWGISDNAGYPNHLSTGDMLRLLQENSIPERVFAVHMYPVPGMGFEEQVKKNLSELGEHASKFHFPSDLEIVEM